MTDEMRVREIGRVAGVVLQGWRGVLTHTHTYSGRADHGGAELSPESYRNIAAWAQRVGAAAVAMGSPWTKKSAEWYGRYDGDERGIYYGPGFDQRSVLETAEVAEMLREAQACAEGRTKFFLDNETPKGRYGHLWWLGWKHDFPAWHDYDQDFDRWMVNETNAGEHGDEPMPYARRPYLQIVAEQRAAGAAGFWAHPTSWWYGEGGQFITNIAAEMPVHAIAEGYVDGVVVMGYHPYRPQYLGVWHDMLDRGYRVAGVAEMDVSLSDARVWKRDAALLNYVEAGDGELSEAGIVAAGRAGRMFASSGPRVNLRVDGKGMGEVVETSAGCVHRVSVEVSGPGDVGRVELVGRGGKVLWGRDDVAEGTIELEMEGLAERGYVVARVFGVGEASVHWRDVKKFAVSNPVYLHPRGAGFNGPTTTEVEVVVAGGSEFAGGKLRCETAGGALLSEGRLPAGTTRVTMPASGRICAVSATGRVRTDYLVNANRPLQDVMRYLYRGRFLEDFPALEPGEVPVDAWPWERMAGAMREMRLEY